MPTLPSAVADIRVPFFDVDSMDVVWHGHYVKYLEVARCALLDSIDYGYTEMSESGYAWPVVKLALRYTRPAVFGQELQVTASMIEWELRLVIEYAVIDRETGAGLSSASTTQMAVETASGETCLGSPPILEQRLKRAGYL